MDYAPIDVELRFRGGQRQETVATTDVEIIQDGVVEPTEEFLVDVVATRNSIVLTPVVTVRIIGIGKLFFTHAIHHYNGSIPNSLHKTCGIIILCFIYRWMSILTAF